MIPSTHGLRNAALTEADHRNPHRLGFTEDVTEGFAHAALDPDDWGHKTRGTRSSQDLDRWLRMLAEKCRPDAEFPDSTAPASGAKGDRRRSRRGEPAGRLLPNELHGSQVGNRSPCIRNQAASIQHKVRILLRDREELGVNALKFIPGVLNAAVSPRGSRRVRALSRM